MGDQCNPNTASTTFGTFSFVNSTIRENGSRWNVRSYLAVVNAALCGRFAIETTVVKHFELVRLRQSVIPIQAREEVGHRE